MTEKIDNPPGTPLLRGAISVRAADGEVKKASLYMCPDCGGKPFMIFQIEGQSHEHLQCAYCDATFCFNGACE